MLLMRQLFDAASSTWTYLLADPATGEAVLIDPVWDQVRRDATLLRELGLTLRWTLETHVHADHVSAGWRLQRRLGSSTAMGAHSGAQGATRLLEDGDRIAFGARHLTVRATPGHTDGCVSYVLDDGSAAFTGDALLVRGCGRTDFQQGSARRLYRSVRERLFTLPPSCLLYPAHDYRGMTVTSVAEETRHNPRLGGEVAESDFAGFMDHLKLPHPKQIDVAVPANLRCGRPAHDTDAAPGDGPDPDAEPDWAPGLVWSFAGLWEIAPAALEEAGPAVQRLDVREPDEFDGPLGHLAGALPLPLGQLQARLSELDRERPVVAVCRSGARSAQAVALLERAGFGRVANLAGGMLRWRAEGGAVVGGSA